MKQLCIKKVAKKIIYYSQATGKLLSLMYTNGISHLWEAVLLGALNLLLLLVLLLSLVGDLSKSLHLAAK